MLVSCAAALILVESAIRLLDPLGVSSLEESSKYNLDKVPDPILVYTHAPSVERTYQGVEVSINELGLRDRPVERKAKDEFRILLLGDSVTFGWGVPIEATFGRRLEPLLTERLGRPVRTINAGVGSYTTVQEYSLLQRYFQTLEPDLVSLLFVGNDIVPNDPPFDPWSQRSLRGKSPPEAITILLRKSWFYRLGLFAMQQSVKSGLVPRSARLSSDAFVTSARGVRESMTALAAAAVFSRERGVGFMTFFYRSKDEAATGVYSALLAEVSAVGGRYDFPVVDLGPLWGPENMRSLTNSVVDSHPNSEGHRAIADAMAPFVMKEINRGANEKAVGQLPRQGEAPAAQERANSRTP
ncbi:MAG: SGNH/GDSL hydrolase family protein [Acidobacteriota bacterium]